MLSRFMMNDMRELQLKLEELAQKAGISPRTVRYYVQRGLVPPPTFRGKDSSYGASHLLRLKVIGVLQAAFYPLENIKGLLATKDDHALEALLRSPPVAPTQLAEPAVVDAEPRWRKIVLAPGVELLVREGGNEDARVRRVLAMFEEEDDS